MVTFLVIVLIYNVLNFFMTKFLLMFDIFLVTLIKRYFYVENKKEYFYNK